MSSLAAIDRDVRCAPASEGLDGRVLEAMLDCIGRWGIAKTTADDIARAAGISRATLYRMFPGGMDVAFDALLRHETARFFGIVAEQLDEAATLEELLVVGITEAARFLAEHEALAYVLAHEPERVLPASALHRLDRAIVIAAAFVASHLRRFVADEAVAEAHADWIVRIVLSYAINPSPTLELTRRPSVRRFVTTYLLPAFRGTPSTNAPKEH